MKERSIRVAVVGGGASGMMAAIAAARGGAEVVILERLTRVGKKLLATGNGRCNLTNLNCDLSRFHGADSGFAAEALARFGPGETLRFFEELGIPPKVEEEGKVFPLSEQASSVLDILRHELERLSVRLETESEAREIKRQRDCFFIVLKDGRKITADRVILAAGGKASPQLGSDGSGYRLATDLGHALVDPFPALVQLKLKAPFLHRLKGVKFVGEASVLAGAQTLRSERGEILFTDYGISGPPILQISRKAAESLAKKMRPAVVLDLFPALGRQPLAELLRKRKEAHGDRTVEFGLVGFLHKRLIPVILAESGITDPLRRFHDITEEEIGRAAGLLKGWRMEISGTHSWAQAQVTAGGVDTRGIRPGTMESKIIGGLFLCGEILDIDGDSGGFNLQWAWSSGTVAGIHAARI
jgi:predicted Rossmann fold flavoprotein